ncbi:hypothetical protein J3U75_04485 [Snodgrassella sp. B3088]|uniref:hypothetical protein n=1 Tax=Snodgrassella sp. B3088 TaxID=2818038 RepID=UPI002269DD78|nr:hypothetical protein [Snodgrassella sp. B3088]MCT6882209.1 hypothetical protein [Snodgrassella alvi]MCX8748647.1 hypothetical protein [Snodgrassella sp. B3088]
MAKLFNKIWKYSFLGVLLSIFIVPFLPLSSEFSKYTAITFVTIFLFLTIVRLLFAMAAPPIVTARIEKEDR